MGKLAAKTYSRAIFELGDETGNMDLFLDELKDVTHIITGNKQLFSALNSPNINIRQKKNIAESIFGGKVSREILNFLKIIIDKKRMSILKDICMEYEDLVREYKGYVKAVVYSTGEMGEEEKSALVEKLEKTVKKKIELNNIIDNELIGGIIIRIGDKIIDGSIKGRLKELENILMK